MFYATFNNISVISWWSVFFFLVSSNVFLTDLQKNLILYGFITTRLQCNFRGRDCTHTKNNSQPEHCIQYIKCCDWTDAPKFYDCKTSLYEFLLVDISLLFMFLFDFMLKLFYFACELYLLCYSF